MTINPLREKGKPWHRVTKEERDIIRSAGAREAGAKACRMEPGLRCRLDGEERNGHGHNLNVRLLSDDEDWQDTDLYTQTTWSDFCRGFELAERGRAVVDFYCYSLGHHGELEGNVVAYWEHDVLMKVVGTMGNIYWQRGRDRVKRVSYQDLMKEKITDEEKARWEPMLHATWHAIGNDVEVAFEGMRQKLTRAIIVETVLDCNYLETYGGMTREENSALGAMSHKPAVKRWLREVLNY